MSVPGLVAMLIVGVGLTSASIWMLSARALGASEPPSPAIATRDADRERESDAELLKPEVRSLAKTRLEFELVADSLGERADGLSEIQAKLEAALLNHQETEERIRERNSQVERLKRVVERHEAACLAYLTVIDHTLQLTDLSQAERAAAERELKSFARTLEPLGIQVLRPNPGDPFMSEFYQATGYEPSEAPSGTVARCVSLGAKAGDRLLKRASVTLSGLDTRGGGNS